MSTVLPVNQHRVKKGRSPSYPGIPLGEALDRARVVYDRDGKHAAPVNDIIRNWGYHPKSGLGTVTLAALKKFGLLEDEGSGDNRLAKLTGLALDIILDERPDSLDRDECIRRAAMNPTIHAELWREYGGTLPSESTLRHKLVREREFTETGAREFIQEFKATIAFAKLYGGGTIGDEGGEKRPADRPPDVPKPLERKVMHGIREAVFTLEEGPVVLQWPAKLSAESFADFDSWLQLIIRKAKRAVQDAEQKPAERTSEGDR